MRKFFAPICILFVLITPLLISKAGAYFSSSTNAESQAHTATLSAEIINLQVIGESQSGDDGAEGSTVWSGDSINDGIIRVNHSVDFSFTVQNTGTCALDYSLALQLSWEGELSERGNLLVYPASYTDETIIQNIAVGDREGALVWLDAWDISVLDGGRIGINAAINSGFLAAGFISSAGSINNHYYFINDDNKNAGDKNYQIFGGVDSESEREYNFKLFFYESQQVTDTPLPYHNNNLRLNINMQGGVADRITNWTVATSKAFEVRSVVDTVVPTLSEIPHTDTYHITQADAIDLYSFVMAHDKIEGNLTENIVISSVPDFNPQAAGEYQITYDVKNSFGNSAQSLTLSVTIWDFEKISSGYYHTLALTTHGKVYAWGYNGFGQLGDGTIDDSYSPKLVSGLDNIVDVAAGIGCSYALTKNGQIYAWGRNENGRLGDGTVIQRLLPTSVSQGGLKFKQISARFATAGAVTENGEVYTWGYGGYGAAGTGAVADNYTPTKINLSNISRIEMGFYNGAAVTTDGRVYTWGDNLHGQLGGGIIGGTTNAPALVSSLGGVAITEVSVGWYHMSAVSETGQLYTWGYGLEGRLGNNSTTDKSTPQSIAMPSPVKKPVAGYYHTSALLDSGEVYFFGQNAYGKHGTGNTANHPTPTLLPLNHTAVDISVGMDSSFVLTSATQDEVLMGRQVYGMGYGGTGVLGNGDDNSSTVPVLWDFTPPPIA